MESMSSYLCTVRNWNEIKSLALLDLHVNDRIAACRRAQAYYAMQDAGSCNVTTNANMLGYLWESVLSSSFAVGPMVLVLFT